MAKDEQSIINKIEELIYEGKTSNEFLVSNMKLSVEYLNLKRVSEYAKYIQKSAQGLRKTNKIIKICDYQFIVDNDQKRITYEKINIIICNDCYICKLQERIKHI